MSIVIAEKLVSEFHDNEVLVYFRLVLGIDSLLQPESVTRQVGGQTIHPLLRQSFDLLRAFSVLDPYAIVVGVYVRHEDVDGHNTGLYLIGKAGSENHHRILLLAVAGPATLPIDIARYLLMQGTVFQQPVDVALNLFGDDLSRELAELFE